MSDSNKLWTEKYRPEKIEDLLISKENLQKIHIWINGFIKKKDPNISNCLLIYGPPGSGKTSLAYIILKKYKYDIIELNASELRKQKVMNEKLHDILQKKNILSLFQKKKTENAIIMDEIDGLTSGEKGTLTDLIKIMFPKKNELKSNPEKYRYKQHNPFICISNVLDKKINEIKNKSIFLNVKYPSNKDLDNLAKKILTKEKKNFDDLIIKDIVKRSQSDMRRLITILEYTFNSNNFEFDYTKCKKLLDNFDKKSIDNTNYDCAESILNDYLGIEETYLNYNNKNIISIIIHENFINKILNKKTKTYTDDKKYNDILSIYNNFTKGDIIDLNIYKNQYWDLNIYYCLYTCIEPSFIINKTNISKNKTNFSLKFSTLLNKTSLEYLNLKFINSILVNYKYSNSVNICDISELISEYKIESESFDNLNLNKLLKFSNSN